jgi:uncharacterized RDD family membrane protein YckC
MPTGSILDQLPSSPPPPDGTEICAFSTKRYPRREMVQYEGQWIAIPYLETYRRQLRERENARDVTNIRYAGFWVRLIAKIIDGAVLWAAAVTVVWTVARIGFHTAYSPFSHNHLPNANAATIRGMKNVMGPMQFMAIGLVYEILLIRSFNATLGKLACGLRLMSPDGSKLGAVQILARHYAAWISTATLLIGFMMAGWDREKRALHDRICGTRVVHAK